MRRLALAALGAGVIALLLVVFILPSGGGGYTLKMSLADAEGLRTGSAVVVGGIQVGKVSALRLADPGDRVLADLHINAPVAPVGKDSSATITAVNLLGQKEVQLAIGNRADPAPSGFVIPASRITPSTDLDQVLNVLDPNTRARLSIFIDEAGIALAGRKLDLNSFLTQLPPGLADTTQLLNELVSDNHTLGNLLQTSGQLVNSLTPQRANVARMVRVVGQTAGVLASRRSELLDTLARAPGALTQLRIFLGALQQATVPLGPAARAITATAPPLTSTLAQLDPFRLAADPTLATATRVAPSLTRLALGATPVLVRAQGPLASLATFSTQAVPPVGDTLNHSVDNIIAIVADWAHAIQGRDGLSHIFRGEVAFTAEALRSAIGRVAALQPGGGAKRTAARGHLSTVVAGSARSAGAPQPPDAAAATPPQRPPSLSGGVQNIGAAAQHLLSQLLGSTTPASPAPNGGPLSTLLKYLFAP